MTNKDIFEYIKGGLKRGFPLEELKSNLLARGFFDYDISEAINELNSKKEEIKKPEKVLSFFSPKFVLYSVFGFFVMFLLVIFFLLKGSSSAVVLSEDLSEGVSIDMMQNKIQIELDGEKENLELEVVLNDSIKVNFGNQNEILEIGEEKEIDLDGDGLVDISVKLESIVDGIPKLYFKKIEIELEDNEMVLNVSIPENEVFVENEDEEGENETEYLFADAIINQTNTSTSYDLSKVCESYESNYENVVYFVDNATHFCNNTIVKIEDDSSCCELNDIIEYSNEGENIVFLEETEHLKFIYNKEEVQTGEIFDISYEVSDLSEDAKLLLYRYKKDEDRKYFGISEESVNSISTVGLKSFVDGEGFFETDFFYVSGIYIYEIELYFCSKHNSCDSDYSFSEVVEDLSDLEPDEIIYKEIIVSGETIEYQCNYDADCKEPCENCKEGVETCVYKLCQDCFLSFDCKEGYDCVNRTCVLE